MEYEPRGDEEQLFKAYNDKLSAARARDGAATNARSCRCDALPSGHRQHPVRSPTTVWKVRGLTVRARS